MKTKREIPKYKTMENYLLDVANNFYNLITKEISTLAYQLIVKYNIAIDRTEDSKLLLALMKKHSELSIRAPYLLFSTKRMLNYRMIIQLQP